MGEPHDPGSCSPLEGGRGAAYRSAGGGQDPAGCWQKLSSAAQTPTLPGPGEESTAARGGASATSCPLPPHTSFFRLPFPVLPGYLSSPSSLVSTSPHCLRWESSARHKQCRTLRPRGWGLQFPQASHSPCPWIFSSTEVGAPGIFRGERSHSLEVWGEEGPRSGEDHRTSTPELWLHNWPSDPHHRVPDICQGLTFCSQGKSPGEPRTWGEGE